MKKRFYGQKLINLLPLLLFLLFSTCAVLVLLCGTRLYGKIYEQEQQAYISRTARQYLYTKLHQATDVSSLSIEDFHGETALKIKHSFDGQPYYEYIYHHDGWLNELLCSADSSLSPEDGEPLLKLALFSPSITKGLLHIEIKTTDGQEQTLWINLPAEEEDQHND